MTRPGARLFGRRCSFLVAPPAADFKVNESELVEFDGFRTTFQITKTLKPTPNASRLVVYNLAAQSRSLFVKGARVILQAGYGETIEQIAQGDVRHTPSAHDVVDWVTPVELDDGGRGFGFGHISESFAGKTPAGQVLLRVARELGVGLGNAPQVAAVLDRTAQYEHGIVLTGRASAAMEKVTSAWGYTWSIQDGQLQIVLEGDPLADIVVLSPSSGLLGTPEFGTAKAKGGRPVMKLRSLLQGRIKPGVKILLESEAHNGLFRAEKVVHTGDTAPGALPWWTDIEATATT